MFSSQNLLPSAALTLPLLAPTSLAIQMSWLLSYCSFAAHILPLRSSGSALVELHVGLYNISQYLFIQHKLFYYWV